MPDKDPVLSDRSADDGDEGWGDAAVTAPEPAPGADAAASARAERARREADPDVRRLLADKPPHWS